MIRRTILATFTLSALLALTLLLSACGHRDRPPAATDVPTPWATSVDGVLSLRLIAPRTAISAEEPFVLLAELRNNTDEPINVLRPFGDKFGAAWRLRITGPDGTLPYTGSILEYEMAAEIFITLGPGEVIQDRENFRALQYAGSDTPGRYTIVYPYSVSHDSREMATSPRVGKHGLWVGEIISEPITIEKR